MKLKNINKIELYILIVIKRREEKTVFKILHLVEMKLMNELVGL